MHFLCKCGHRISDTSDSLTYSARVIPDVDLYDYWEAWERRGRGQSLGVLMDPMDYEKVIFQCEECGRIYFDDPDNPSRFLSFAPEEKSIMVTGPVEGDQWKGYIYGCSDLGMERGIDSCFTNWNNGAHEEYCTFDSYEEMRSYFDAKVEELKEKNLIKSAWVNKDGETVFRWSLEKSEPVQAKMEVYLSEDERTALEKFKADHVACHHKYPRGAKGWDFSYEVFPGICGADDRDLKVTCLRCGASLESVDKKIAVGAKGAGVVVDDLTRQILDLLHEHGSRDIRAETISMPGRYYDIAAAVGYVRGLLDAALLCDADTPLVAVFQHCIGRLMDADRFSGPPELRHLIRRTSTDGEFDWVIEEGMEQLKETLRDDFPEIFTEWVYEPKHQRG